MRIIILLWGLRLQVQTMQVAHEFAVSIVPCCAQRMDLLDGSHSWAAWGLGVPRECVQTLKQTYFASFKSWERFRIASWTTQMVHAEMGSVFFVLHVWCCAGWKKTGGWADELAARGCWHAFGAKQMQLAGRLGPATPSWSERCSMWNKGRHKSQPLRLESDRLRHGQ